MQKALITKFKMCPETQKFVDEESLTNMLLSTTRKARKELKLGERKRKEHDLYQCL